MKNYYIGKKENCLTLFNEFINDMHCVQFVDMEDNRTVLEVDSSAGKGLPLFAIFKRAHALGLLCADEGACIDYDICTHSFSDEGGIFFIPQNVPDFFEEFESQLAVDCMSCYEDEETDYGEIVRKYVSKDLFDEIKTFESCEQWYESKVFTPYYVNFKERQKKPELFEAEVKREDYSDKTAFDEWLKYIGFYQ